MECLTNPGQTPVLEQLVLMQLCPCQREPKLATRQRALDDFERVDPDLCAALRVTGMEVRGAVIVEEHCDRDPEEATDCRHHRDAASRCGRDSYLVVVAYAARVGRGAPSRER